MTKYIIRLDDACERMNTERWNALEKLLDKYNVKPLVGIIPRCEDGAMDQYPLDAVFWNKAADWVQKGWTVAMHGYNHRYTSKCGGINPVNGSSEFAGLTLEEQKKKIAEGVAIMRAHGINPTVFFAPGHTFDENTIEALKACSDIRIVSDTVASKPYCKYGITFVPLQAGVVRRLPFDTVSFSLHPNHLDQAGFERLESFLKSNHSRFIPFPTEEVKRKRSVYDVLLQFVYLKRRKLYANKRR